MTKKYFLNRIDKNVIDIAEDEILVFCCVRNERLRLPYFLEYHRNLGVERFFVIDNASDDGTTEYLLSERNVHVFYTEESYAGSKCGVDWLNHLLNQYGIGHWTLTLDADELLIYPLVECVGLKTLTTYLESVNSDALETFMLDMYSDLPISETVYSSEKTFFEVCRFFDTNTYQKYKNSCVPFRGGPRHRVFWEGKDRENLSPVLRKIPLIKWREQLSYIASTHEISNVNLAPLTGVLAHFKFFSDFYQQAEFESIRKEHWDNAAQYQSYWDVLQHNPKISLIHAEAAQYNQSSQLVDLGLMSMPDSFLDYNNIINSINVAAVTVIEVEESPVELFAKATLGFCDALIFVVKNIEYSKIRERLVKLQKEGLPVMIVDFSPEKQFTELDFFKLCANTSLFFPYSFYLYIEPNTTLSGESKKHFKGELASYFGHHGHLLITDNQNNISAELFTSNFVKEQYCSKQKRTASLHAKRLHSLSIEKMAVAFNDSKLVRFDRNVTLLTKPIDEQKEKDNLKLKIISHNKDTGIFNSEFHTQNLYLDYPPFRYISDKYSPQTVLDLGCGLGGYIQAFKNWGAKKVLGVDGFSHPENFLCQDNYLQYDLRYPIDLREKFDLVINVEVIEHISAQFEMNLINSVNNQSKQLIVFSAAQPKQPGNGHVNCQPIEYWIDIWKSLGWGVNVFDTLTMRAMSTFYWLRRNLLVLQPIDLINEPLESINSEHLISFEAKRIKWAGQKANVYHYPLIENLPIESEYHEKKSLSLNPPE